MMVAPNSPNARPHHHGAAHQWRGGERERNVTEDGKRSSPVYRRRLLNLTVTGSEGGRRGLHVEWTSDEQLRQYYGNGRERDINPYCVEPGAKQPQLIRSRRAGATIYNTLDSHHLSVLFREAEYGPLGGMERQKSRNKGRLSCARQLAQFVGDKLAEDHASLLLTTTPPCILNTRAINH
jgi:hypothetical protein